MFIYLVGTRKLKWRGREIFELAAEPVEDSGNGYTSRPRPSGKLLYGPEQIRGLARFASRHLIALPSYIWKNVTYITSVTIWTGNGREREERKIKLTTPAR